ncbi:uncharacterized protein LOC115806842 [Chanos chanos]|uniref:Uncharacterized protein LOC115806842 n=1 Tax=Chanos chanos TaxID=29144 RepID=A0A6J2UV13_CHACN|nr:uncharacterized protein LOC115806842 [Chanos chanos]
MFTKCGDNVSGPSEVLQVETKEVILKVQVEGDPKNYTLLASGKPSVYKVNLEDQSRSQFCQHSFGRPSHLNIKKKTIMLLGATGSGKTTLINGMINYILGVKWEDECRFKLIDEVTNKTQAQSQTSEVTAYRIHHRKGFQIDHSLTIIDTPGFGDTRGIKQDKAITDRIREFFSHKDGIAELDAVCFVVQSALARLTHTQKYIFEAILSIFGKDVADNIVVLVTFADGQTPPVLEAIKSAEIPCAKKNDGSLMYFKFNNSALFAPNNTDGEDNFDEMFWKMGTVSMQKFFVHLSSMKTQSLQMTKEVLTERNKLEVTAAGLQPMIQVGLGKLDEIKSTEAALKQHIECIEANKNFEYEVETFKQDKIDLARGTHVTNCLTCNHTCHYPCGIPKDEDKSGCWAMTNSYCRICPGKCIWNVHHNVPYRFEVSKVKKKCTYENLKKQYENALGEKMSKEKIFKRLETDYEQVQVQVHDMINDLSTCLKRLKEIALRPDPLATPDYIDLMIQSEEQEAKPGFQKRIKELTEIRQKAVIMQKLVNGEILSPQDKTSLGKIKEAKEKCTKFSKGVFNTIAQWFQ